MMYTKHSINSLSLCGEALALLIGSCSLLTLNSCQRIFQIKCHMIKVLNVFFSLFGNFTQMLLRSGT